MLCSERAPERAPRRFYTGLVKRIEVQGLGAFRLQGTVNGSRVKSVLGSCF